LLERLKPKLIIRNNLVVGGVVKDDAIIESIHYEPDCSFGEVTPDGVEVRDRNCLVIRAKYMGNEPVYIGLAKKGEFPRMYSEHKFYDGEKKCTASFYNLPDLTKVDLVIIPVSAFKEVATRVEFKNSEEREIPAIFRGAIQTVIQ